MVPVPAPATSGEVAPSHEGTVGSSPAGTAARSAARLRCEDLVQATPSPVAIPQRAAGQEAILVALDGRTGPVSAAQAASLESQLRACFPGRTARVLLVAPGSPVALVGPAASGAAPGEPPARSAGLGPAESALGALLAEGDRQGSATLAMLVAGERDEREDALRLLFEPVLGGALDYVCPIYPRGKLDGMLNTAIVYPLHRALFGRGLRQPAGGEAVLGLALARELIADRDWRRDPVHAGSDAWLVAKVLSGNARVGQAWLGAWPLKEEPVAHEDASHLLARVVGPVFHEVDRHAARWQRVERFERLPTLGHPRALEDVPGHASAEAPAAAFRLGLRELGKVWGLVLPPATLLELKRAAAAPDEAFQLDDGLWARVVYDFALAYATRAVERGLLLRSMTPLYLGFVAGFVNRTRALDGAGTEDRIEALCGAFEGEKRYAIARWRWPDHF